MTKNNFKFFVAAIVTIITIFTIAIPISMKAYAATTYSVIFPVNNNCTIYRYQKYDPRYKDHDGVDIHSSGDDTIYAAKGGTVEKIANDCDHIDWAKYHDTKDPHYSTGGNMILIKGDDNMYYWYMHLKQNTIKVKKGQRVEAGQAIATMGSSGQSTGKHLHFVMTTNSSYQNRIIANPVGTYNGQVYYSNGPYNESVKTLSSISISTSATKTEYWRYEKINTNGLIVKVTYSDKSTKNITSGFKVTFDSNQVGTRPVNISYTEGGVTKTTSYNVKVSNPFNGEGTASNPYQISNADDLFRLAKVTNNPTNYNNAYGKLSYIQTDDINLENKKFTPIGKYWTGTTYDLNYIFDGTYNGNYHKITNLLVNGNNPYQGLFGHIHTNGIVENLSVNGIVNNTESQSGGIVGEIAYGGTIRNCDFTGSVTANVSVGGIVGSVWGGMNIENCYCNATITASVNQAGGIIGVANLGADQNSKNGILKNCYFTGIINCEDNSGGICGSYFIQSNNANTFSTNNCYYLNTACNGAVNNSSFSGSDELDMKSLKEASSKLGYPYIDGIDGINDGYPVFEWQGNPYTFKGSGTESDPYLITNAEELKAMRDLVNSTHFNPTYGHAYYIQTEDITLQQNEPWTPIGLGYDDENGQIGMGAYNYQSRMFYGVYDGNQHTIYNLIANKNYKYSGMFGYVRGEQAVIKNLAVEGLIYTKESSSGGGCAGGIAGGLHYGATIENCAFIGNITGNTSAGGITGTIWMGGTIKNCYHLGECYSNDATGGISGVVQFGNATTVKALIENCYHADGTMNSTNSGGIVGKCIPGNEGVTNTVILNNCYAEYGSANTSMISNATSDNTAVFSTDLVKGIAANLGVPFVDNPNESFYNGYPIFEWQVPVIGDCNNDGTFTMADAVMLQKWLVNDGTQLINWEAADLDKSYTINVFDLCFMKEMLLTNVE